MTASNLALLGFFLMSFNWSQLTRVEGVNQKLDLVNYVLFSAQDAFCPLEEFSVKVNRYPFATARLAKLSREKGKEFKKNGYSEKFKRLKKECKNEIKQSKQKRINEVVQAGPSSNSWLGRLESLLDSDGKSSKSHATLPEHQAAGLSLKQQADDFAHHIGRISREYVPLEKAVLPDRVAQALASDSCAGHPNLEDHVIFDILSKRKITCCVECYE